jgi:bloom syndrome protein
MTDLAKQAVQFIKDFREHNVTLLYVVEVLRGSRASRIKPEHRDIECHGVAKELQRGEVERLFTRLLMDNILVENNVVNKVGFVTPYLHVSLSITFVTAA